MILSALFVGLCLLPSGNSGAKPAPGGDLLRVRGAAIVDGKGRPVVLRGVSFGNEVWSNARLPRRHHDEADYQRVAAMGMNAVRFYLNYKTFEADAAPGQYLDDGWQWLDDNVAWAKRHGVYLILNMHVPPGGFQSLGAGKALWDRPEVQDRLIALWTAIARHCKGEPTIAGYDLLNEPVVTKAARQWRDLAARIAVAIRTVDTEHMLFVERLNSVAGDWSEDAERGFFRIPDPNTVYEFHFYKPFHFTHQSASWVPFAAENVRYPDARAEVEWFLLDRKAGTEASPKLPPGDSPWTFYPGAPFKVEDPAIVVGKPVLVVKQSTPGKVWFDDLTLEELDDAGQVKRVIWEKNLTGTRGWYFWTKDAGKGGAVRSENGHGDRASIVATEHRRRRQPGRGRAALPRRAGRDLPPVGMDARREDPARRRAARSGSTSSRRARRCRRATARSWSRRWTRTSPGAGARMCRCSWARLASSASGSTRIGAACAGCRTCSTSRARTSCRSPTTRTTRTRSGFIGARAASPIRRAPTPRSSSLFTSKLKKK